MMNVAILGSGTLGTDLLIKVIKSPHLNCVAFVGRNSDSRGLSLAKSLSIPISSDGIAFLETQRDLFDLVFDATNAYSHLQHWPILEAMNKKVIDLTPSHIGHMIVPSINLEDAFMYDNISLISCGGQSSLPVIHVLSEECQEISAVEVVSCIASKSAGPATRININEYIEKTEEAIRYFSKCKNAKSILILSPAQPEIYMKTTLYVEAKYPDFSRIDIRLKTLLNKIQKYIPGYRITLEPLIDGKVIVVFIQVKGCGDFLPCYAGNLDIISCAAVQIAEAIAIEKQKSLKMSYV